MLQLTVGISDTVAVTTTTSSVTRYILKDLESIGVPQNSRLQVIICSPTVSSVPSLPTFPATLTPYVVPALKAPTLLIVIFINHFQLHLESMYTS